jgi:hypothetical protein
MPDFSKSLATKELEKWQNFTPPIYNVWKTVKEKMSVGQNKSENKPEPETPYIAFGEKENRY